jgi:hypothetical protein
VTKPAADPDGAEITAGAGRRLPEPAQVSGEAAARCSRACEDAAVRAMFAVGIALGLLFRDARVSRGLTQADLSGLTGIPQADISRIERGAAQKLDSIVAHRSRTTRHPWPTGTLLRMRT